MRVTASEFLTIDETAEMLRVSSSTIRRWIRAGTLTAHRAGRRRILLRKDDVTNTITVIANGSKRGDRGREQNPDLGSNPMISDWTGSSLQSRLSDAEKEQGLQALLRLQELNAQLRAQTGKHLFSPSWLIINESRDERTRQLSGDQSNEVKE